MTHNETRKIREEGVVPDHVAYSETEAVVAIALQAGKHLAERLNALKVAVETGNDHDVLCIAREITKAKVRHAA